MKKALVVACCCVLVLAGCGSSTPAAEEPSAPDENGTDAPPDERAERPMMSAEDCEAQGGEVVGDIGDGAIHRPDYVCASGAAPIGTIPLGVEGSVCCPGE